MIFTAIGALVFGLSRCGDERPAPLAEAIKDTTKKAQDVAKKAEKRSFTLAFTGDFLTHDAVLAAGRSYGADSGAEYDFTPMFDPIRDIISAADFAICHQEVPVSADNTNIAAYPVFNSPKEVADAIAYAGYDGCSTASNHSTDRGTDGIVSTLRMLGRAGIKTEGTNKKESDDGFATLLRLNGVTVGWLSYTYGLNGSEGLPYEVNILDTDEIIQRAKAAKDRGAEFVFLSMHWGTEFQTEPNEEQRRVARRLLRSPAIDLIVGHHVHVPQPIKRIGKEFVVFGLGNILSNQRAGVTATCCPVESQDGLIAQIRVEEQDEGEFSTRVGYTPTWVEPGTFRVFPVARMLNEPSLPADARAALQESWRRTITTVNSMGARRAGVRPTERPTG